MKIAWKGWKCINIQAQVLKLTLKSNIPITAQYCTEKSQIQLNYNVNYDFPSHRQVNIEN